MRDDPKTDRAHAQADAALLLKVAEATAGEVGHAFLIGLVEALRSCMEATLVFLTRTEGDPAESARAIYAVRDGEPVDGFSYDLDGTPCLAAVNGETVVVPCDLAKLFPKEAGFQGYFGLPIRNSDGAIRGHLAVLSAKPIDNPDLGVGVARLFGQRVEAEIRRREMEREREALIQDLGKLNGRLRRRYQSVHSANAFKTRLLGMIAHDLRNPLSAIAAQGELLQTLAARRGADLDRIARASDRVVSAADRMAAMIDATLERAREETASLSPQRAPADLRALLRVAAEANRDAAAAKDIELSLEAPRKVRASVDPELILEAIDNLISNAIKYSYPGAKVSASACKRDGQAVISVVDQGQGLTSEDLARAFRPFETLSAKPTSGESATGLGLANVREVAEAHGGAARAESAGRDQGARFEILLPL